jgi:uncharacterized protein (DUF983 family)
MSDISTTPLPAANTQAVGASRPDRPVWPAMRRGASHRCPACGRGKLFHRYLKVSDTCPACGEALHHQQADDAPPYMTIFVVGHILVPMVLWVERGWSPPEWVHLVLWLPLTLILTLSILPVIKGALFGLQWALRMHGFNDASVAPERPAAVSS